MSSEQPKDVSLSIAIEKTRGSVLLEIERQKEIWTRERAATQHQHEWGIKLFDATQALAQLALKTLLLVNGGAAIAVLTFVGNAAARGVSAPDLAASMDKFVLGAGIGLAATVFSYLSQFLYRAPKDTWRSRLADIFRAVAMVSGVFSFLFFLTGANVAATAFGAR